ncbi:MAG: sugar ABC transporter ATP-binding protein [Pseudomonadota bacterium]
MASPASAASTAPLVSFEGLTKHFGATQALRGVTFDIKPGETVGLLGANGAGKSTLIKALAGIHRPTSGKILVEGQERSFRFPDDARNAGVATVHQNIDDGVVFGMTVAENLMLDEIAKPGGRIFLNNRAVIARAREVQRRLELDLPLEEPVENLTPSRRQEVAIARELAKNPKLLILDEPTSTLSEREAEKLFAAVLDFKHRGIAILYITHRLSEVELLCDRVVVLRDGLIVSEHDKPIDRTAIASSILGELVLTTKHESRVGYESPVTVRNMRSRTDGPAIGFDIKRGEVLGLTGLIGAGKSELLEQICGHRPIISGEMTLNSAAYRPTNASEAMRNGVVMVPEQRALQSIFPGERLWHHGSIGLLAKFSRGGFMQRSRETSFAADIIREFKVVSPGPNAEIEALSGGNQQKFLVGRWMRDDWNLLVLDEPFRGIDIGARGLISAALREYSERVPVLLCSSDPEEVIEVADSVLIMVDGAIVHHGRSSDLSAEQLAGIMGQTANGTARRFEGVSQ